MNQIPNMTMITPSNWLAGLVRKSFLAQYPVKVIHNGIDTTQFFPMENDFRKVKGIDDKFMILGVATVWDEMKGYSDYLKLADILGTQFKVVMLGLTKDQIKKLPENILGLERTNSIKELAYLYSAADLFINLSYCENYPTVNIEAMACGTPVLTYDTGGSPESIKKYKGIVIERGDVAAVVQAVRRYQKENKRKPKLEIDRIQTDSKTTVSEYLKIMRVPENDG